MPDRRATARQLVNLQEPVPFWDIRYGQCRWPLTEQFLPSKAPGGRGDPADAWASLYSGCFRPRRRLGFSMPWRARCWQRALSTLLRSPNSILRLKEGGKESIEMKSSITSVIVAAILLAGTFAARAQFTEGDVSHPKAHSTHH